VQCLLNEVTYCLHKTGVKFSIGGLDPRQGAKHAKFRREKINYLEKNVYYFPIFAAFASLREIFRVSVVAMIINRIKYQQRETLH
jgi:hypothetical protein